MTTLTGPVQWGSRLQVVPEGRYTEVGGTPVVVLPASRAVQPIAGAPLGLLLRLDGRRLDEVLAAELTAWGDAERRSVIDVLRRLKALDLIEDVPAAGGPAAVRWSDAPEVAEEVRVRGRWWAADAGDGDQDGSGVGTVVFEPWTGGDVVEVRPAPTADDATGAAVASLVVDDVERPIGWVDVVAAESAAGLPTADGVLAALAAWVRAVESDDELSRPGVLDLLAQLAETLPRWAPPSLPAAPG